MGSASENTTQAMTSQQNREWEEDAAKERKKVMEQQAKSPQRPGQAKIKPPTTELLDTKSPDFLHLIPLNETAKLAFSELLDQKKAQKLSPHHFQYMVETGRGPLRKPINYQARSRSETPDVEYSAEPATSEINLGYFKVSFDYENVTDSAKWVIGRGSAKKDEDNRNVDILLAVPGSKYTKGLLAAHVFICMHRKSGIWMIRAALESSNRFEDSAPMAMATLDEHEIFQKGFRCLDKPEARLSILDMEFRVQFALTTSSECLRYRDLRNLKLKEYKLDVPDTDISGIPLVSDIRIKNLAVFSLGLGSGTFGAVYEGFDPESGDLRVVKVIELKREHAAASVRPEVEMAEQYPNTRGLVRQYGWCNSNGDRALSATKYPVNVYIIQGKGEVFHQHTWHFKDRKGIVMETLKLTQDLLHGLHTIHQRGWMHRDITVSNMLYFKGTPAEAALCDFGKLHLGRTATGTSIAAWAYLPPEIVEGESKTYDQSIDVWMLAYALVRTWYFRGFIGVNFRKNGQITRNGLGVLRTQLYMTNDHGLAKLFWAMLSDEPHLRPTPEKALQNPCFRRLIPKLPQEPESSQGKRRHVDQESTDGEAVKEQANRAE